MIGSGGVLEVLEESVCKTTKVVESPQKLMEVLREVVESLELFGILWKKDLGGLGWFSSTREVGSIWIAG
jgi:hypothetical protein